MRYELNLFIANWRNYGVRSAWSTLVWNVQFNLGYRIGKFTSAKRDR